VAIEPVGEEDTYDLTVDVDHNFVADGIVVHNSHAAAYAVVSYRTAYLKANYAIEYMTALLIHLQGSLDKVAATIVDCKKRGIEVLPPSVNESREDFTITGAGREGSNGERRIRFGLGAIKNVGRSAVEQIVLARESGTPYKTLDDLCERIAGAQDVNARALEALVRCGACDELGERNHLLAGLERARQRAEQARRDRESGQTSLFGLVEAPVERAADYGIVAEPMPPEEKLRNEKELLGLYLSDHPLNRIEADLARLTDAQAIQVTTEIQGSEVRVGGLVREVRRVVTRSGQIMAYVGLEDLTGTIDVTLFPRAYEQFRHLFEPDTVVVVQGKVEPARPGGRSRPSSPAIDEELDTEEEEVEQAAIIAEAAWAWDDPECAPVRRQQTTHVDVPGGADPGVVDQLASVLTRHPGSEDVLVHFQLRGTEVTVQVGERFRVAAGPPLKEDLDSLFGQEVTRFETVRPRAQPTGRNGRNASGNGRGQETDANHRNTG
jgi:DNA polymerase-3 subunit alpha